MISDEDLEAAVTAGVLDRASVERLRTYVGGAHAMPSVDEEHFRLISGFNDIFYQVSLIRTHGPSREVRVT
jgi:hypothetical protein